MTRRAMLNYGMLAGVLSSWLGVMWGLDMRLSVLITVFWMLAMVMDLHRSYFGRCHFYRLDTRCALGIDHDGPHTSGFGYEWDGKSLQRWVSRDQSLT